jgi:hypothetical protein
LHNTVDPALGRAFDNAFDKVNQGLQKMLTEWNQLRVHQRDGKATLVGGVWVGSWVGEYCSAPPALCSALHIDLISRQY